MGGDDDDDDELKIVFYYIPIKEEFKNILMPPIIDKPIPENVIKSKSEKIKIANEMKNLDSETRNRLINSSENVLDLRPKLSDENC